MSTEEEYTLHIGPERAALGGVMRLASVGAYTAALAGLQERIEAGPATYEVDISGLSFLNSSGITALSRLVLSARQKAVALTFVIDEAVLWQRKTLPSLARLYPKVVLRPKA